MENIVSSYEEPERWRAPKKLMFRQVSIGLNRIITHGVPDHLNQLSQTLRQASQLMKGSSTWASDVTWDDEAALCRSRIQQALSTLMQDLRSLEEMRCSVRDEEMDKFKEVATPSCQRIHNAIQEAKPLIAALERPQAMTIVCQSNEISPSSSSGFEDFDGRGSQSELHQEQLFIDAAVDRELCGNFEELAKNISDLKDMMNCMQQQIVNDGETVERIDSNVETAAVNIGIGQKMLAQARHLKTVALPATFATVGFVAGGPIGAMAGVRVGIAASLLGTAVGYMGGKLLHNSNKFVPPMFRPRVPAPQVDLEPTPAASSDSTSNKKSN